jgi:hypothetical protein
MLLRMHGRPACPRSLGLSGGGVAALVFSVVTGTLRTQVKRIGGFAQLSGLILLAMIGLLAVWPEVALWLQPIKIMAAQAA